MNKTSAGQEIIDATQNAVMEAAQNVSNIMSHTANEIDGHHEVFYMSAEFWVGIAFLLVVLGLFRPITKIIRAMLRRKISGIISRLDEASQLQVDAQKLLSEYERKYLSAKDEADTILKKSQKEVDYFKTESLSRLEQEMKLKTSEAEERLNSAKEKASQEITSLTSELAIQAVKQAIYSKLDNKEKSKLIDNSIDLLSKIKV